MKPLTKQAKIFEIRIIIPETKLLNNATPTVPIINIGPLIEQKESILTESSLFICLL
jgi:hypothetical protein